LSNMQSPRTMLGHQMTDDAPRPTVTGWETEMYSVELENRLHAIWEKQAQLELSLYRANVDWFDAWPVDAPRELRKMAADVLETACELDAIARDLEMKLKAKDEWGAQVAAALVKGLAEAERDRCTQRLGEIVRMSRKPEK